MRKDHDRERQTELKRIQKELGLTFAFVAHDQEEAMAMGDRVAVMGVRAGLGLPQTVFLLMCAGAVFVAGVWVLARKGIGEQDRSRCPVALMGPVFVFNAALFVAWPRRA
ncbi:hypothetical protein [Streptomyces massasporeus]|uniref:hypothetical protein n=1 Tax=Streptomyces massasporeus TaxID=67324 RepID=UPI0033E992A1